MRERKRRVEAYSFFDHKGIAAHLEYMAAKGWMIEKLTNFGWVYRRITPKKLHFAVSYYPKASEFDPEPSEEQQVFYDFCRHTGWKLACASGQMQIFYNEGENPTPIETEPQLELEAIRASAKKSFIPSYMLLLAIALLNGIMLVFNLREDPIGLLSSPSRLFSGFAFLLLGILCLVELASYFLWLRRAEKRAEEGEFLPACSTSKFQKAILAMILLGAVYWAVNFIAFGNPLERWIGILMCLYVPSVILIVNGVKNYLKRKKASRGVNRAVTILTSFIAAFVIMGAVTLGILKASSQGLFAERGEETYEHGGMRWVIHEDKLPLVLEDLIEVDYDGYIREKNGDESLFLGNFEMRQYPRLDADSYADLPRLEYTLIEVKIPAFYEMCRNRLIEEGEQIHPLRTCQYQPIEASEWGALEAYRLYDPEYGPGNQYLLCYGHVLVEIYLDWEPTASQKAVVGERLNIF